MSTSRASRQEATVLFLPHRLNRQPVIVRGLTADELWITVGLSALCGLLVGIALAVLTRTLAVAPTCVVLAIALGVAGGGSLLRRHKRGRPEVWLYRQMQWWVARHAPWLARHAGASDLITRSGSWTTRRERAASDRTP